MGSIFFEFAFENSSISRQIYLLKFIYSRKATKIWRNPQTFFELTNQLTLNKILKFHYSFVAFSE